jgi:hypothetical protein
MGALGGTRHENPSTQMNDNLNWFIRIAIDIPSLSYYLFCDFVGAMWLQSERIRNRIV